MSLLSKLFGGAAREVTPELYEGFRIYAEPVRESGGYRLAARIEKEVAGETLTHHLIRADVFTSEEEAARFAAIKARLLIDQLGEGLFA